MVGGKRRWLCLFSVPASAVAVDSAVQRLPPRRPRRCGVVGEWQLEGDCAPLLPWLWLGQWLHVGKNATMGMGQYRLLWD